jgi:hypothetical protein
LRAQQSYSRRGVLSADDWERRLVAHYLRSDGPSGGTPLIFLDATPAELAIASEIDGIGDVEAQQVFIDHFEHSNIHALLSGNIDPPAGNAELPTFFRYLVLTCLVSATDAGAGDTRNFRMRLGELLNAPGAFNSVSGVNALWKALVRWCDLRRAAGQNMRRVILPDYGNANLIGYAVRIAFPSWRDRSALTKVLRELPQSMRCAPERLVQELSRSKYRDDLPDAVASSLQEFAAGIRARRRMLIGHRFWRLILSVNARLTAEEGAPGRGRWRLDVRFEGYELDIVRIALFRGSDIDGDEPSWEGALQELTDLDAASLPSTLSTALRQGVLMLTEAPGALWSIGEEGPLEDATTILLAREGSAALTWPLPTTWRSLAGRWFVSGKLGPSDLIGLRRRLGLAPAGGVRLLDLAMEAGAKIDRSTWLGRPTFLPNVVASSSSELSLETVGATRGALALSGRAPCWGLHAETPVSGRWRVHALEAGTEIEKIVCFEEDAPERWEFPTEDPAFEREHELLVTTEDQTVEPRSLELNEEPIESKLWDTLEAIYTSPKRGWAEGALVDLLQSTLPARHFVWDFLRSFAEAGWLEAVVSQSWGARRWRLCPPHFETVGPHLAVVRGALGAAARRRLGDAAAAANCRVVVRAGVSVWAPPWIVVQGDARALSRDLTWSVRPCTRPRIEPAPRCWPAEPRSVRGRTLAGLWSFELGMFLPPNGNASMENAIRLERLVRERGDDRDLYRISGIGEVFLTGSRTVAILEAHRRSRIPLFEWGPHGLERRNRGGHLPMAVSRALGIRHLRASGPALRPDGSWTYLYPTDLEGARWVGRAFGPAIRVDPGPERTTFHQQVIAARRLGRRPSWYVPEIGRGYR